MLTITTAIIIIPTTIINSNYKNNIDNNDENDDNDEDDDLKILT